MIVSTKAGFWILQVIGFIFLFVVSQIANFPNTHNSAPSTVAEPDQESCEISIHYPHMIGYTGTAVSATNLPENCKNQRYRVVGSTNTFLVLELDNGSANYGQLFLYHTKDRTLIDTGIDYVGTGDHISGRGVFRAFVVGDNNLPGVHKAGKQITLYKITDEEIRRNVLLELKSDEEFCRFQERDDPNWSDFEPWTCNRRVSKHADRIGLPRVINYSVEIVSAETKDLIRIEDLQIEITDVSI